MTGETILVVDDEEDILELVRYNLEAEGYEVVCAVTGEEALQTTANRGLNLDLVILDLMLPGIDGLSVARVLKAEPETRTLPIIMLTAKGEEADIVAGLNLGADDYITKPFSPKILVARTQAVIRRRSSAATEEDPELRFGELAIDVNRQQVTVRGEPVDLTHTEFEVLAFLVRRPGWVFTRSRIVDAVHGENYPVTDRSVDVQVAGLRKKLGDVGRYIETVRGVGYRFRERP
jgi:two-component system phosphate regulon response regulator PhoB